MMGGFRARPWVGIDIGEYSLKLVGIQAGGARKTWVAEVPYEEKTNGKGRPDETVARAIEAAFSQAGLPLRGTAGISVGIAGPDVILKQVSLPLLDEEEIGPALRFEARKHLPFDPQTMVIDHQVLGRFPSEKRVEILLAAVSRDHLDTHLAPFKLLDLEPDIVDATPLALANAMITAGESAPGPHVIVDIGWSASHLVVIQQGQPFFSRRLPFGGAHVTQAIADSAKVPLEEAEEWKLSAGSDHSGMRVDWNSPELVGLPDALRRQFMEEIMRSLAFYRTQASLSDIPRIWISGGSARLPGLPANLSELMGITITAFDPVSTIRAKTGITGTPQFVQAYGLASRAR